MIVAAAPPTYPQPDLRMKRVDPEIAHALLREARVAGYFEKPISTTAVPSAAFALVAISDGLKYHERVWKAPSDWTSLSEIGELHPSDELLKALLSMVSSLNMEEAPLLDSGDPAAKLIRSMFGPNVTYPRIAMR